MMYPEFILLFLPMFSGGLVALTLLFKIHKRSVSSFITILTIAVVSTLIYYSLDIAAMYVLLVVGVLILARAMTKPANDKFIIYSSDAYCTRAQRIAAGCEQDMRKDKYEA